MNFIVQTHCQCDGVKVIFVDENRFDSIEQKEELLKYGFKVESESAFLLQNINTIFVGIKSFDADDIRCACAEVIRVLKPTAYESVCVEYCENIEAIVEGFELGSYEFNRYKSKSESLKFKDVYIVSSDESASEKMKCAKIVAEATNYVKDIVNTIPHDYTPVHMASDAMELDGVDGIECKVFDEDYLQENRMNAFLAVSRASEHPPRLIHLSYKAENPLKKVVFVGKGLTYDSGGLSLKPSSSMVSMKSDKSGGAAVMGIIKACAKLKLPYEIHAIVGATENMIGGDAYKPDDVLVARNGVTIEVQNTDAEGRLVLADCLCYAQELKPDLLIDIATLTGACVVALGEFTFGVMGHNHALKHSLHVASAKSGELSASLPFNKHLKKLLKSNIADISNISSSRYGGAITAGLFLDRFIEEENKDKWLHLDIAGPAFVDKPWGYNQAGASGAGVRACVYWLKELQKNRG